VKHEESYDTLDAKIMGLKAQIKSAEALLGVYEGVVAATPHYIALSAEMATVEKGLDAKSEQTKANDAVTNALPGYQKVAISKAKMAALNQGATKAELEAMLTEDAQAQWKFHFKQAQFSIQPSSADAFAAGTLSKHGKANTHAWQKTCPVCEAEIGWEETYASVQPASLGIGYLCHVPCVPKGALMSYTHANVGAAKKKAATS
jgi:hypothetical protein